MTSVCEKISFCVLKRLRSPCHRRRFIRLSSINMKVPPLDKEMIDYLERLSLVEFNNKEGVERLRSAIKFANQMFVVNTDGVDPLDNVLEDRELYLRNDEVTEGGCRPEILQNATKTEEDYFVAPPGNIPLKAREKHFDDDT